MNNKLTDLIARYGPDGDFTHRAPAEAMLAAAERLLDITIPEKKEKD